MSLSDISYFEDANDGFIQPGTVEFGENDTGRLLMDSAVLAVGFAQHLEDWSYLDVFSSFWRLYYNNQPGKSIKVGRVRYPLNPGKILLVPPRLLFSCESESAADHFWIHFTLPMQWRAKHDLPHEIDIDLRTKDLVSSLEHLDKTPENEIDRIETYGTASAIVQLTLCRLPQPDASVVPMTLEKVLRYIQSNPGATEKVIDLAKTISHQRAEPSATLCKTLGYLAERLHSRHENASSDPVTGTKPPEY